MDRTFHHSRKTLIGEIASTIGCLVFAAGGLVAFLLTSSNGPGERGGFITFWLITWGILLSFLISSFIRNFIAWLRISDGAISVRSAFALSKIDISDIERFRWIPIAGGNSRLVLSSRNQRAAIRLFNFSSADKLEIIRLLHALVPESKQEGWPRFCHLVALPLRDGSSAMERERTEDPLASPDDVVPIKHERLDRALPYLCLFGIALIVVISSAFRWGAALVMPLACAAMYFSLLLFTSRTSTGRLRLRKNPFAKTFLIVIGAVTAFTMLWGTLMALGVRTETTQWIIMPLAIPLFPLMFYMFSRVDKRRKDNQSRAMPAAVRLWNEGEQQQVTNC